MSNYNTYGFNSDVPFIPSKCCEVNIDFDTDTIKATIEESMETIENKIQSSNEDILEAIDSIKENVNSVKDSVESTKENIDSSKEEIIEAIKDNKPCLCNVATKEDIKHAICHINHHTDVKFEEIDFISQFDNLNKQINDLKNNE